MVKLNHRFLLLSSINVIALFRFCVNSSIENNPDKAKRDDSNIYANEQNAIAKDELKNELLQVDIDEKDSSQYPDNNYKLNRMNGIRNSVQLNSKSSADRKYSRVGNYVDTFYRQPERGPKERPDQEDYKSTRIKESETAERNLKKLLKILNENMFFQSGGIPQSRNKDQSRKKLPDPTDDDEFEEAMQDLQVSYPKSLSPDNKDFAMGRQNDLIKEILKKEYKKIFKSKDKQAITN